MAYSTKVGSFVKIGTTSTQAITGVGFQPKAILLFSTYQASLATFDDTWRFSHMISDGAITFGRSSISGNLASQAGTPGYSRQANAFCVIGLTGGGTPTVNAEASVQSLDVDGFTLHWTTNDSNTTARIFYLALGGSDLTGAKVLAFTPHGRTGQQSVTGMGFRPSAILFMPGFSATVPTNDNLYSHHEMGCAISAAEQWAVFGWSKGDGSRPTYTTRFQRDDICLAVPPPLVSTASDSYFGGTDRTLGATASFVSRDLDGFTLNWNRAMNWGVVYALGLRGGRYALGSLLKLQGSQAQSITGLPFQPAMALIAGDGRHEDSVDYDIPITDRKLSFGVADASLNHAAVALHDLDLAGFNSSSSFFAVNARSMSTSLIARIFDAAATPAASSVLAEGSVSAINSDGITVQWANADALRRQLFYLLAAAYPTANACSGGGVGPTITDPAADVSIVNARTPIVFVELALDGGTKRYAKVPLADPATYFGGYKDGRLLSISAITRALSDINGNFQAASATITLDDTDRTIRTLEAAGTLLNRRVDVYIIDDADRRAGSTPRRVASLQIRQWKPIGDLTFSIDLGDWFGAQLIEYQTGLTIPQRTFSASIFSGLPSSLAGVPEPVGYGSLSDESNGVDAVGVVPLYYTGQETISGFLWDRYVVVGHAVKAIQSWFASDLGQNPTGTPTRLKMPATTEGVDFLIPGSAGWNAATGSTATYRDYGGRRYTVIFARGPRSDAHKDGSVPMALNVCGLEDVGDGTGAMIDALPTQLLHALTNWIVGNYQAGAWLAPPAPNSYSLFKSVAAAVASAGARVAGGYKGAFLLGGSLGTMGVSDFLTAACQSCDVNIGPNRHGQIVISMEDNTVAAVASLTDLLDIDSQGLDITMGWQDLANTVPYRFGKVYVGAPSSNGPAIDFAVDTSIADGAAKSAQQQTRSTAQWDLLFVQDPTTGDDVVARVLARRSGGAAPYRGPVYATIPLGLNGTIADLGDNISVTHFAGLGSTGWVNQKLRVMGVTLDTETMAVSLSVMKV